MLGTSGLGSTGLGDAALGGAGLEESAAAPVVLAFTDPTISNALLWSLNGANLVFDGVAHTILLGVGGGGSHADDLTMTGLEAATEYDITIGNVFGAFMGLVLANGSASMPAEGSDVVVRVTSGSSVSSGLHIFRSGGSPIITGPISIVKV